MTEINENQTPNRLPSPVESFILQWGDLGSEWGVNRSVSQIHAYLYLAERPLTADDICRDLNMARSNVSNSLKELMVWNLIRRVPVRNDRRDHFEAETDVWEIAARIAAGRKAREIDPALTTLRKCVADAKTHPAISEVRQKRLREMLKFTESVDRWYGQMLSVSPAKRDMLLKLGSKVATFLPGSKAG